MSTPTLVVVIAAVLLVIALTLSRSQVLTNAGRLRRAHESDGVAAPISDGALEGDELVLVPLPNHLNEALVLGTEQALGVLDASGLSRRSAPGIGGPLPQLVRSAMAGGGIEATRRAQRGIDSGRIVALSKETMEHLDKGKPVYDKAQNMLGIVKGERGKISHVMRLDRAGAQAVVASNAATLAVTAALSQQLDHIAEQLTEISDTLDGMVRDKDRERLSEILAANEVLMQIAEAVQRRGMTETDANQLAALKLSVTAKHLEAEFKFEEVLGDRFENLTRAERLEKLNEIVEKERLDYWLAVRVQADLARTRSDLLTLYWEHEQHPESAGALNESTAAAVRERQRRLAAIGQTLRELSDPAARTRLDPFRQLARYRLGKEREKLDALLEQHGDAFTGPDGDPYSLIEGTTTRRALDAGES